MPCHGSIFVIASSSDSVLRVLPKRITLCLR